MCPPLPAPLQVASLCAENVVNTNVPCCGMAGDRGMRYPELTGASLQVGGRVAGWVALWGGWPGRGAGAPGSSWQLGSPKPSLLGPTPLTLP